MNPGQFLRVLRARSRLAAAVAFVVVAAAFAASLMLPQKYSAETALVVDAKSSDPIAGGTIPSQLMASHIATQVDIIGSERVALRVVELAGLDRMPQFQAQWQAAIGEGSDIGGWIDSALRAAGLGGVESAPQSEAQRDAAPAQTGDIRVWIAAVLRSGLEVKPARESNVIRIRYTASQPEFAAMVANTFAQAYMETALELKVEPARQYAQWFDERTQGLRDELEAAQKRLSDYQQKHGVVSADGRLDVETARLAELSTQLVQVQGQRADSRSRYSQAGSADSLPEVTQNPLIASLKADLARREAEREQLRGRLGPNHPEVGKLAAVIDSLRQRVGAETQRIAASLGTSSRISAAREAEVAAAVEAQKARVLQLKAHRDQIAVLQRDVEGAQKAYEQVAARLTATSLESQSQQTNVAVLTPAAAPMWPSGPRLLVKLALALMVGVVLGVGSAVLIELIDRRVRGEDDLAGLPGMPVLGSVPGSDHRGRASRARVMSRTAGAY
ncbi:chain length determinant protein EpsF [Aromatoleum petrolei]|uniref:Chain length determinant protein EpsF n=1 Tax=Aromatoleum petrolei TaxID=76116 RepID=A0ABX1MGC4_9RHOO|nr:chain length determinant protein EpsF [Aromatoleum petrolei]NMF86993.1 chain length determinant protein EpsF [Aromatoleum petrolei]QTQ37588.1 Chain length determinant family protein [Aromatoleum petrolei]